MPSDTIVRRLRAWGEGKPLPRYSTIHFPIAANEDALILAFVRMGGESSPWGIAVGHPGAKPIIVSVPEARNRNLVADMVAGLAPILLSHFHQPEHADEVMQQLDDVERCPLRQLWVPNPSHLDLLHALAYSYTFTKWGAAGRARQLNAVGRLAGWLFREAHRPGQVTVMSATTALRSCYTFPSSDLRQSHLGYLLAWLETRGDRDRRLRAATEAEQQSISISLDPAIERDELDGLVETWGAAQRETDERKARRTAGKIDEILGRELRYRHELVERTFAVLRKDARRTNTGVAKLERESKKELWFQYLRIEQRLNDAADGPAFVPSPETDRYPAAAAARYYVQQGSEEFHTSALLHDDEDLQNELIATGDAVRGRIASVRNAGVGKALVPMWVVEVDADAPLRIRAGTRLCVAGLPGRVLRVEGIAPGSKGKLEITGEVISLKTVPKVNPGRVLAATDSKLKGKAVTLLPAPSEGISRLKGQRIWERNAVGSWLTHALPGGVKATVPEGVAESIQEIVG
jgi:hypothetical protein